MEKITVKEYARLNGTSIYNVIKMIQRRELQGVTLEENGVKVNYVVLDEEGGLEEPNVEPKKLPAPSSDSRETGSLAEEVAALREEVARLVSVVEQCCKDR